MSAASCFAERKGTSSIGGLLQFCDARARAVLVLLGGPAADAARAVHHAATDDGYGALARDHVAALGGSDALDDRAPGALLELAARTRERDGGDRLALRAVRAGPDRAVHAVEGHQASAAVAHRHADLDAHLPGFVDCALHDRVGFREGQRHVSGLLLGMFLLGTSQSVSRVAICCSMGRVRRTAMAIEVAASRRVVTREEYYSMGDVGMLK